MTRAKSAAVTVRGKPFDAVDTRRGKGPAKGAPQAGRPSHEWRDFLRDLRADPTLRESMRQAARDPESRAFGQLLKLLASYDPDGPDQRITVESIRLRLEAQVAVITRELPPEQASRLLAALAPVWQ